MTEIKKNHSLRRIRLMKRAAVIRQNNGMDKREALVVAHQIDVLIRKMYLASVSFYYTKQDGSIRHAVGTLTGYEHCFHRPYTPRPESQRLADIPRRKFPPCRMRTPEERKEWERLCRQYNVDSLYEAIEGCREELEFLVHCAERLEPLPDDDTPALRPRRATIADHAV